MLPPTEYPFQLCFFLQLPYLAPTSFFPLYAPHSDSLTGISTWNVAPQRGREREGYTGLQQPFHCPHFVWIIGTELGFGGEEGGGSRLKMRRDSMARHVGMAITESLLER